MYFEAYMFIPAYLQRSLNFLLYETEHVEASARGRKDKARRSRGQLHSGKVSILEFGENEGSADLHVGIRCFGVFCANSLKFIYIAAFTTVDV